MNIYKKVSITTNYGNIILELNHEKAPKTVENFILYVKEGFYDGTIFHRIIDNFMIQGGGFSKGMIQKNTHNPIENEAFNGLKNLAYTIAMARTNEIHSATSQFFINLVDNNFLDYTAPTINGWGYTVFGKVIEGIDTVDKIGKLKTKNFGFYQDVPIDDVIMKKVELIYK
ncbi:Peptidyl-prolyl cis-trans isomerase cyp18 [Candidatus Kinetoplastibacterium sorsogonicusi]|uniref:Peptidyl-prolyl cis-trans isomerase n=1 Tax=Candidatus Kinetoplastidibacterium kentomonadis TaxID=1576550 RepID=A0A3S7J9F1_9PROT|nr:peptidylprolyl isomerase [Candidatus Kinetoplastibacterium sorsogonicusi]AWD32295.1 Peptidyl-prolyl cis-trans isomerase cyp18 [Candidatus Kinetoplastibacterium sorsogonicusi]